MLRRKAQDAPPPLERRSRTMEILQQDVVSAIILLLAAVAALLLVNFGYAEPYEELLHFRLGVSLEQYSFVQTLHFWINEGLMAVFFFLVGLEIKRELLAGELASVRKATLPAIAALGGMVAPSLIFAAINAGQPSVVGWGIPMATDIAFALGCMSLLGQRVPVGLSVFLMALAIIDDLGSVLVIAVFYTERLAWGPLLIGSSLIAFSYLLSLLGVRHTAVYVVIWIAIWLEFLESGVHSTIAGVLVALTIPTNARYESPLFRGRIDVLLERFQQAEDYVNPLMVNSRQQELIHHMIHECRLVEAPLQRIEHRLHPIVVLAILPLFAFANSGVHFGGGGFAEALFSPVTLGIFFGLLLGKQIGIVGLSWLAVRLNLAELPEGVTWRQVYGMSWLAGIGFTMALFISQLAYPEGPEFLHQAKVGILLASVTAGVVGYFVLRGACRNDSRGASHVS
jgi:NhaA family Na+:H+ antiporter